VGRKDGLNTAQRIVVVVATGIALAAIGVYLANRGSTLGGHHFLSAVPYRMRQGSPRWLRLIIWLVLDGIWAVVALVVLRSPPGSAGPQ
jgi:hypothetical protein